MNRVLTIVAAACLLVPASAAAKSSSAPSIDFVTPMRVKVGKAVTVRGAHFAKSPRANKVVLESAGGRRVIVVPSKASSTKLVFTVPKSAERILTAKNGVGQPTRTYLRVITKVYGKRSALRHSPVIVSARSGADPGTTGTTVDKPARTTPATPFGTSTPAASTQPPIPAACGTGSDWDSDLLDNTTELQYGLDPCRADSDGDGMGDGWEYWSAKDLNVRAVPYPGKKPYPNPLDAMDGATDFDGDSLTGNEEYRAWVASGKAYDQAVASSPLGYSAGTQYSRPNAAPAVPAFKSQLYGLYPTWTRPTYPAVEDSNSDGRWRDDERDADSDGLTNFIETHNSGIATWWSAVLSKESPAVEPWPGTDPSTSYSYYGAFSERPFQDTQLDDADVDGDTLLDAEDDQDADDVPNYTEMYAPGASVTVNGNQRRKNAFNPCAPDTASRTCPAHFPVR